MASKHEGNRIVAMTQEEAFGLVARSYQLELMEKARRANSIIFLGTGTGKTFIAVMLIKELGFQTRDPANRMTTIFMVNTVALVDQQAQFIRHTTGLKVKGFCGADGVDKWSDLQWRHEIQENQVMVIVGQVFLDLIQRGFFSFRNVNLLVIDEVHHAAKNHPYSQVMKRYGQYCGDASPGDHRPRILGLSASIVNEKCDAFKFMKLKSSLEELTDSRVITTENLSDMLRYGTAPEDTFVGYQPQSPNACEWTSAIIKQVDNAKALVEQEANTAKASNEIILGAKSTHQKQATEKIKKKAKEITKIMDNLVLALNELGFYPALQLLEYYNEEVLESKQCEAADPLHEKFYTIALNLTTSLEQFVKEKLSTADAKDLTEKEKLLGFSSHKVLKLLELLEEEKAKQRQFGKDNLSTAMAKDFLKEEEARQKDEKLNESSSSPMTALVFVQMRQTAAVLSKVLMKAKELVPGLNFLRPNFVVGGQTGNWFKGNMSDEALEKVNEQRKKVVQLLARFRAGEINCMVSTSVLEEGIDVKMCNLVVRFDPVQNFRSYVQSKGRARAKPSKFAIFHPIQDPSLLLKVKGFQELEQDSLNLCHTAKLEVESQEPVEEYLSNPNDPQNSPRITSLGAIALVYQYVQKLPCDRFTILEPYFELVEENVEGSKRNILLGAIGVKLDGYRYRIHFPPNSSFSEPLLGPVRKTKLDAKRAASLRACKILHQKGHINDNFCPRTSTSFSDDELLDEEEETKGVGTKKRKQYYPKSLPPPFLSALNEGKGCLYQINLRLVQAITEAENVKNRKVYHPENHPRKLGIVVGSRLPSEALRPFSIFTPSGKVLVWLSYVSQVSATDIEDSLVLHKMIFEDVLKLVTPWMKTTDHGLRVVALKDKVIDRALIRSLDDNKSADGRLEHFEDAVVIPLHRSMERCHVQAVMTDQSPLSKMEESNQTYVDFYESKYSQTISDMNQPLLRVSSADKQYESMMKPIVRPVKDSEVKKFKTDKRRDIVLIPELVAVHPIPSSLWWECQMLPHILNRVVRLSQVSVLRNEYADFVDQSRTDRDGVYASILSEIELDMKGQHKMKFEKLTDKPNFKASINCPMVEDFYRPLTATSADEGFDLEREEILGDCFLKFATSVYLFMEKSTDLDEGDLTAKRSSIVGNKNLYRLALKKNLQDIFGWKKFIPSKNWMPPGYVQPPEVEQVLCHLDMKNREQDPEKNRSLYDAIAPEDINDCVNAKDINEALQELGERKTKELISQAKSTGVEPREHVMIADKALADSVEALIGSHLKVGGQAGALKFMKFMGIELVPNKVEASGHWFTPPSSAIREGANPRFVDKQTQRLLSSFDNVKVQDAIGYKFKEPSFLLEAMTHCSYIRNNVTLSMERLEFLGDAVIDYLVTCQLVIKHPELTPGDVTNLRSALVNNNMFAQLAVNAGLHTEILQQSPVLLCRIEQYICSLEISSKTFSLPAKKLLEKLNMHNEKCCAILEDVEVPKVLGDTIEALMGAVFLDSGFCLKTVWSCLRKVFPTMDQVIQDKPEHPVKALMEMFPQSVSFKKVAGKHVNMIMAIIENGGSTSKYGGIGPNFSSAKRAAATCALREIQKQKENNVI